MKKKSSTDTDRFKYLTKERECKQAFPIKFLENSLANLLLLILSERFSIITLSTFFLIKLTITQTKISRHKIYSETGLQTES